MFLVSSTLYKLAVSMFCWIFLHQTFVPIKPPISNNNDEKSDVDLIPIKTRFWVWVCPKIGGLASIYDHYQAFSNHLYTVYR